MSVIEMESSYESRRTVAFEMFNNRIPLEITRAYMGHSNIKTTNDYILNNRGKKGIAKRIHKSLKNCKVDNGNRARISIMKS